MLSKVRGLLTLSMHCDPLKGRHGICPFPNVCGHRIGFFFFCFFLGGGIPIYVSKCSKEHNLGNKKRRNHVLYNKVLYLDCCFEESENCSSDCY